jgi:hypothetical protein
MMIIRLISTLMIHHQHNCANLLRVIHPCIHTHFMSLSFNRARLVCLKAVTDKKHFPPHSTKAGLRTLPPPRPQRFTHLECHQQPDHSWVHSSPLVRVRRCGSDETMLPSYDDEPPQPLQLPRLRRQQEQLERLV